MKVGLVGCGMVGSASVFALVMQGVGREIVLVDANPARAEAEADNISHAVPFGHPLMVRAGDYLDLTECRADIISAGVAQTPGETRPPRDRFRVRPGGVPSFSVISDTSVQG